MGFNFFIFKKSFEDLFIFFRKERVRGLGQREIGAERVRGLGQSQ